MDLEYFPHQCPFNANKDILYVPMRLVEESPKIVLKKLT